MKTADARLGTLAQVGLTASYPMFARDGHNLFIRHFYYPSSRTGPNQVTLSAPRLQQVVPPALWPYYERLAPGLAAWLEVD